MPKETWQQREAREAAERAIVEQTIAQVAHLLHATVDSREGHRVQSGSQADPQCSITVTAYRPADQIAREIQRRIVPVYRQLYRDLAERNARYTKTEDAKEQQADRIAYAGRGQRLGERDPWRRHEHYPTRYVTFGGERWSNQPCGEAEITGVDKPSISMKLYNLTPELAEYIAALFGEWAED